MEVGLEGVSRAQTKGARIERERDRERERERECKLNPKPPTGDPQTYCFQDTTLRN